MTPGQADAFALGAAAYVHIPFCSAICPYCDFAVVARKDHLVDRYVAALLAEIDMASPWRPLDAVYLGGGTPSHVAARKLAAVLARLDGVHGLKADAELSIEANPEDFDPFKAGGLRSAGFNRVSFGAQSFDRGVLGGLGRRHRPGQIADAVVAARQAGFVNVSIDLIFGTPGETNESWRSTLREALRLEPDHVSAYALTVERGTPLGRAVATGAAAPDPDVQADRYEMAESILGAAGLSRYEVSNWSRPGFECRYNLTVWAQGEYEAYGNGAHGFRDGRRFRNVRRLEAYLDAVEAGSSPRSGHDRVGDWDAELDRLFVGLRRTVGVRHGPGTSALLASEEGRLLMSEGVIEEWSGRLRVARPLLTDAVHRSVLAQNRPIVETDGNA